MIYVHYILTNTGDEDTSNTISKMFLHIIGMGFLWLTGKSSEKQSKNELL